MSFSSPREPSYYFPPAVPATTHTYPPQIAPLPVLSEPPSPSCTSNNVPRTRLQRLGNLLELRERHPGASIALVSGCIGIAAAVADPTCIPTPDEISTVLFATVCASGVIYVVLAMDHGSKEAVNGLEDAWGGAWRWLQDRISSILGSRVNEEEVEVSMMFNDEGNSVFLLDGPERLDPPKPPQQPESTSKAATASASPNPLPLVTLSQETRDLPKFNFKIPPMPDARSRNSSSSPSQEDHSRAHSVSPRLTPRYPMLQRQLFRSKPGSGSDQSPPNTTHASGILGPSPMPPLRPPEEWRHFTGRGFHEHQQKLNAVAEWSNPGSTKSLREIVRRAKELDERAEGEYGVLVEKEEGAAFEDLPRSIG
ncbi:hypothetical protein OPT61_g2252 [Boeremia exigua]|uniref:Uncharacterized protein n=1 Tax=Boeremia exigua TaxID=749465 RepID=A0ACC2IMF8_9PLEO|nr:hypothetical protein OPT61_g2252 [Boeremia exigua]